MVPSALIYAGDEEIEVGLAGVPAEHSDQTCIKSHSMRSVSLDCLLLFISMALPSGTPHSIHTLPLTGLLVSYMHLLDFNTVATLCAHLARRIHFRFWLSFANVPSPRSQIFDHFWCDSGRQRHANEYEGLVDHEGKRELGPYC